MSKAPIEKTGIPAQIRAFYDRVGSWLDTQRFYEGPAIDELFAHADFGHARFVYEFGCGTGRLAERILAANDHITYQAVDISSAMVRLTRKRLHRFGRRASVTLSDGAPQIASPDHSLDRFVSTYVFDLLAAEDIAAVLNESHRVLSGNGLLCLVSLTRGTRGISRLISNVWLGLHNINPMLVGGCRPIELLDFFEDRTWRPRHIERISRFGMTSEVIVAEILP